MTRQWNHQLNKETKECLICHNDFFLTQTDKVFCSKSCKEKITHRRYVLSGKSKIRQRRWRVNNLELSRCHGRNWARRPENSYKNHLYNAHWRGSSIHPKTHAKHILRILGDDKIETCEIHKQ